MVVVVGLSLVVAAVLFGVLDSTGAVESKGVTFSGAAAGFFASFVLLQRWHGRLIGVAETLAANEELRSKLETQAPPDFHIPAGLVPYVAAEESIAFCYPQAWRHEPTRLDLIFVEAREQMRVTDTFRGNLNVVAQPTVQRALNVAQVYALAETRGIEPQQIAEELGVPHSPATEAVPVELPKVLAVLKIEGDFAERLYELDLLAIECFVDGTTVRTELVLVDGRPSRLVEREVEFEGQALVQYQVITYVPEVDTTYTFTFTDNVEDRERIHSIGLTVLSTVRFWPAQGA